jgi:GMP synthase (glutamine-hydrolysing)
MAAETHRLPAGCADLNATFSESFPKPFLILETGQPVASLRRHGRFPHWIRVAAGLGADAAVVVDVEHGEALPHRDGFAGVLITGSSRDARSPSHRSP